MAGIRHALRGCVPDARMLVVHRADWRGPRSPIAKQWLDALDAWYTENPPVRTRAAVPLQSPMFHPRVPCASPADLRKDPCLLANRPTPLPRHRARQKTKARLAGLSRTAAAGLRTIRVHRCLSAFICVGSCLPMPARPWPRTATTAATPHAPIRRRPRQPQPPRAIRMSCGYPVLPRRPPALSRNKRDGNTPCTNSASGPRGTQPRHAATGKARPHAT